MKISNIILITTGATLQLISILTLLTNPDSILPILETSGVTVPVYFDTPNLQAIILFIIGVTMTFFAFNQLEMEKNSQERLFSRYS